METIIEFLYRFCSYVMFGFTLEIFFVAISNIADGSIKGRDKYLEGKTYLWMVPIYGFLLTLLFEPMSINLMNYGILTRYIIYGFMITVFEGLTGLIYDKLLGFCPWDCVSSSPDPGCAPPPAGGASPPRRSRRCTPARRSSPSHGFVPPGYRSHPAEWSG